MAKKLESDFSTMLYIDSNDAESVLKRAFSVGDRGVQRMNENRSSSKKEDVGDSYRSYPKIGNRWTSR